MSLNAQTSLDDVKYDEIPYRPVRKYIQKQQQASIFQFRDVKASCTSVNDFSEFSCYTKTYVIKERLSRVWETYQNTSPNESWKTRKSSVGLIYLRHSDEVCYQNDTCDGINLGQVIFVNLKLVKGLYRMATAFEVTRISEEEHVLEVSYIESGINHGKQTISMTETEDGYTQITHTSVIQSESHFRDKVLYPYFHYKLINVFHRQMKRRVYRNTAIAENTAPTGSPEA